MPTQEEWDKLRQPCEVWCRTCGYYRPVSQQNDAKQEEYKSRVNFKIKDKE
jgi:anaerobic ribonucleoside-triphosphate reductase